MSRRYLFSLLISLFLLSSSAQAVEERVYLKNIHKKRELKKLKKLARENHDEALAKAIRFAKNAARIKGKIDISLGEFVEIALFIETKLPLFLQKNRHFISKNETKTRFALEFDPETKSTFIVLNGINHTFLGKGASKEAVKCILYHPTQPELLVRLEQARPHEKEFELMRLLQGKKGLFVTRAFTSHKENDLEYFTIYSDYYNQSSIGKMFKKGYKFRFRDKIKIAYDFITGLNSLHKNGIVHRDIKVYNLLVNVAKREGKKKKNVTGVIADFGLAMHANECFSIIPNAGPTNTSPEGIFYTELKGADYYATDVFALGLILYRLFYEKLPPWKDRKYYTSEPQHFAEKQKLLIAKINETTKERREFLEQKRKETKITSEELLEFVVLHMLHPDPKRRGTMREHKRDISQILKKG